MALVSKPYTFSSGATIIAAEHNSNFDTLYNDYNGNITNANVSNTAAIHESKLDLSSIAQDITFTGTLTFTSATVTGLDMTSGTIDLVTSDTILLNETSAPSTAADQGALYVKESGGQTELFFREESDGTEVQITNSGSVVGGTSNVIYAWAGIDHLTTLPETQNHGMYMGDEQSPTISAGDMQNIFYVRDWNNDASYDALFAWKWTKVAGINTLTVNARTWADPNNITSAFLRLDVDSGTAAGTSVNFVAVTTPAWLTAFTCDVSGLTNGTTYDMEIQAGTDDSSGTIRVYLSTISIEGS